MGRVSRDANQVPVHAGVKQSDGVTPSPLTSTSGNTLNVAVGTSGTDQSAGAAVRRDDNVVTTMAALANDGSGAIVMLYVDAGGNLLVKQS